MRATPLLIPAFLSAAATAFAVPAFPGAEGFGANAKGARASASPTVYRVTNLNDSGPGSLRDAVSASNRVVIFDVGGIIRIDAPLVFSPGLTIAGQSAPGGGVTVYGNRVSFSGAHNTICRYIRFRMGIEGDNGADAVGIANGSDLIFDHVSASWGRDETFSISGDSAIRITLQDCLIAQGLRIHSAGGLMQTSGGVSIFRTLYADNWMRNPKVKGVNDYINNVVYNWGSGGGYIPAGDSAGDSYANVINNTFIAGPESGAGRSPFTSGNTNYRIFHSGNLEDLDLDGTLDPVAVNNARFSTLQIVGTRFDYPRPTTELSALAALAWVLDKAGASHRRDRADAYVIDEVKSYGTAGAFLFNESEMGGIGSVASGLKPADTDNDGMPDWWEIAAGTNPAVADATALAPDGYLRIEHYLNALVTGGVPRAAIAGISTDTGASVSDGVTSDRTLVLSGTAPAGASVALARVDTGVIATVVAGPDGAWSHDYSGTALADRVYAFTATATVGGVVSPPCPAFVVTVDNLPAPPPVITRLTLSPAPSLSGAATPADTVVVRLNGATVATAVADALGNWNAPYAGPALAAGAHTFTALATDLAGNTGAASAAYVVDTAIAAPVFTALSTDTGVSTTDRLTNDPTLLLSGTAPAGATVSVSREGVGVVGSATATAAGVFSFNYTGTALPGGAHTFLATASQGGAASPASAPFVVTVDATAPAVSSIRRQNPATYSTNGGAVVFRVTFAEPVTGVDLADFGLTLSGATGTHSSLSAPSDTVYDVTVTGVSGDGTVRLNLNASGTGIADFAGNAVAGAYTSGQTYTVRLAGSGVWIDTDGAGLWSDTLNWDGGLVASGSGATADFSLADITEDTALMLDGRRTVGRLVLGDSDFGTPARWIIGTGGNINSGLTLAGSGTPVIQVDAPTSQLGDTTDVPAGAAYPHRLAVPLSGAAGFTKTGVGTLELAANNGQLSGALTLSRGIVQVGPGGTFSPSSVTIATSQQLRVAGGVFSTAGNVSWTSGTGTGVIVSGGVASFQNIVPSNARNSFFRVTGGTVTGKDMNFPRSGDSEAQTTGTGVLISGGDTTFANIGLGTTDSWGGMTISGGKLTVTGTLHNGFQSTSGRGGVIYLSGGELNVTGATDGLVMSRNRGANTHNVSKLLITGGAANLAKLTLGYDSAVTAGSATVAVTAGALNLGAGGIVKNGTSGLASTLTFNSGTLGALATWSTTHPLILAGTSGNTFFRAADPAGAAQNFTLGGVVSGTGGFAKTGAGTLTLSAANTFTGALAIHAGTLNVTGSLASGTLAINNGGALAGTGIVSRAVTLNNGGEIAPAGSVAGTLTASSLVWNAGGRLALNLGSATDRLALSGALTKGGAGVYSIAFTPAGLSAGATYTLATFGSTTFAAGDFTATGLGYGKGTFALVGGSLHFTLTDDGAAVAPFFDWLLAHGLSADRASVTADPDGDGVPALLDFATGRAAGAPALEMLTVELAGQVYPAARYTRRRAAGGVALAPERAAGDLVFPAAGEIFAWSTRDLGDGRDEHVVRSPIPLSVEPRQFFRLRATLPLTP